MAALGSASTALRAAHTSRVVTLITGANRGIGFELARQLLRLGGFHVIAAAREWSPVAGKPRALLQDAASEAAKTSSRRLGGLNFVELDVASEASRYALLGKLSAVLGTEQRINVLVNNAGVYPSEWTEAAFNQAIAVNTTGPLRLATDLIPFYGPDAHVINVSTGLSKRTMLSPAYRAAVEGAATVDALAALPWISADAMRGEDTPAYKVSKAAQNRGTRLLAAGALKGIARVNAVDPGWCKTDMGGGGAPRSAGDGAASIYRLIVGAPDAIGTGNVFSMGGKVVDW